MNMTRVSEIMTKDVVHTIPPNASVEDAAKMMKEVGRGCLIVIEKGKPVGIITERDMVHKVLAERVTPKKTRVSAIMSKPVITVGPEALVSDAATIMVRNKIRRLVVLEGDRVAGILTVTDFAKHLKREGRDPMLDAMARGAQMFAEIQTT
jgi:CBS domain-containing protein